jgi:hypothetical protein
MGFIHKKPSLWVVFFTAVVIALVAYPAIAQQQAQNSNQMIQNSLNASAAVQAGFDELWQQMLNGPLYLFIASTAAGIAAFAAIQWLVMNYSLMEKAWDEVKPLFLHFFLGPILVAVFILASPVNSAPPLLAATTLQLHNFSTGFSNLAISHLTTEVKSPINSALAKTMYERLVGAGWTDCQSELNEKDRNQCFNELEKQVRNFLQPFMNEDWAKEAANNFTAAVTAATSTDPTGLTVGPAFAYRSVANMAMGALNDGAIALLLATVYAISWGIAWMLEVLGILTALVGPLAIAVSLFPWFSQTWKTWLTMQVGLGLVSLFYKLAIGISALQVLNATGPIELAGPFAVAILGIWLAASLASGGGTAAFQSGTQLVSSQMDRVLMGGISRTTLRRF